MIKIYILESHVMDSIEYDYGRRKGMRWETPEGKITRIVSEYARV